MAVGRLNPLERYRIHSLRDAGFSLRAIADQLNRAASTISRELRGNADASGYDGARADQIGRLRRRRASQRTRIGADLITQIEALLRLEWRPDQIAGSTALASHEWIYRHIYADQRRGGGLFRTMRRRRKQRRKRGAHAAGRYPQAALRRTAAANAFEEQHNGNRRHAADVLRLRPAGPPDRRHAQQRPSERRPAD